MAVSDRLPRVLETEVVGDLGSDFGGELPQLGFIRWPRKRIPIRSGTGNGVGVE